MLKKYNFNPNVLGPKMFSLIQNINWYEAILGHFYVSSGNMANFWLYKKISKTKKLAWLRIFSYLNTEIQHYLNKMKLWNRLTFAIKKSMCKVVWKIAECEVGLFPFDNFRLERTLLKIRKYLSFQQSVCWGLIQNLAVNGCGERRHQKISQFCGIIKERIGSEW